eukprot:256816_1
MFSPFFSFALLAYPLVFISFHRCTSPVYSLTHSHVLFCSFRTLCQVDGCGTKGKSTAIINSSNNNRGLIIDEHASDLELGNIDGSSSQQYLIFCGKRGRDPVREERERKRTWWKTRFIIYIAVIILWGAITFFFLSFQQCCIHYDDGTIRSVMCELFLKALCCYCC